MAATKQNFKKSKNRRNKIHLVFDETKRKEFLTGFHKRKLQRKQEAKEKFERDLKEERKRLKAEAKESYKKLVLSNRPIPEVEHLLEKEYEDNEVTVKVVEMTNSEMARDNNWIGENQGKIDENEIGEEDEEEEEEKDHVPGMEIRRKPKKTVVVEDARKFDSEKDVKKALKKQATKNMQKSKVFQKKNKLEQRKQRKRSDFKRKEQERTLKKSSKKHRQVNRNHNKNNL